MSMLRGLLGIGVLLFIGILAGCATLNKAQCEAGDWRNLGASDGGRGFPLSYIDEHITACKEHNISVNRQLYEAGRNEGLVSYCRLERAESEGRAGRTNHRVCGGSFGASFDLIYEAARDIYRVQTDIDVADARLDDLLRQVTTNGLTDAQRSEIRGEIFNVQGELGVLRDRMSLEERELRFLVTQEQFGARG
jgi:hypothetical protein